MRVRRRVYPLRVTCLLGMRPGGMSRPSEPFYRLRHFFNLTRTVPAVPGIRLTLKIHAHTPSNCQDLLWEFGSRSSHAARVRQQAPMAKKRVRWKPFFCDYSDKACLHKSHEAGRYCAASHTSFPVCSNAVIFY